MTTWRLLEHSGGRQVCFADRDHIDDLLQSSYLKRKMLSYVVRMFSRWASAKRRYLLLTSTVLAMFKQASYG